MTIYAVIEKKDFIESQYLGFFMTEASANRYLDRYRKSVQDCLRTLYFLSPGLCEDPMKSKAIQSLEFCSRRNRYSVLPIDVNEDEFPTIN